MEENVKLEIIAREYLQAILNYEFDLYSFICLEKKLNEYFDYNVIDSNFPYSIIKSDYTFLRILILRPKIFKELLRIQTLYGRLSESQQFFKDFMEKIRTLALEQLEKTQTTFNFAQLFMLISPEDFEKNLKYLLSQYPKDNKLIHKHLTNLVKFLDSYTHFNKKTDNITFIRNFMESLSIASNKVHLKLKYADKNTDKLVTEYLDSANSSEIDFFDLCHILDSINTQFSIDSSLIKSTTNLNIFCWFLGDSIQYDIRIILEKPELFQKLLQLYVEHGFKKAHAFFEDFYTSFYKEVQNYSLS